jgi:hypothetical protein
MGLSASAANREDRQGAVFKLFFPEAAVVKERSDA